MPVKTQSYENVTQQFELEQLILDHLEYVRHIVGRVTTGLPFGTDIDNLMSAGTLGLVEAANAFDATRGVAFTTFAYPRIRGAIIDELRRNCPVPQRVLKNIAVVRKAVETMPPPATPEQIADETGLTHEDVDECLEAMRLTRQESWQVWDVGHKVNGSEVESPDARMESDEFRTVLADCLEMLGDRERLVITLYYLEDLRLKEIGEVINVSESRVSRILSRAEFRLRELVRSRWDEHR